MTPRSGLAPPATLGIDLGTTNSVLAHRGDVPRADALVPSVVAFPPTGELLVGHPARARRAIDPRHTLASTKRLIGARFGSARARRFAERHPYAIVEGEAGRAAIRTRRGAADPIDVAALILREVCRHGGHDPAGYEAVITVPASFEDAERVATTEAARRAGFTRARLIAEPVATAVGYLARSNVGHAVVYDLGGGTFDIAVVDCARDPLRVVAHAGDPYLGGDDVDRELALGVATRVLADDRWDLATDADTFARLVVACEEAKRALFEADAVVIDLAAIDPAGPWARRSLALERAELSAITSALVRRTFALCDLVLAEARITAREVDAVFLAGGSTKLPGLAAMIGQYFGKRPRCDLDPMHVVAIGASTAATRPALSSLLEPERVVA